ncbi:MAG: 3-oxoacid CoA-transferase subunit B [Myxococcales bacterium]|nr:3-oxoacid CoA-transferase subunit B [Myxococcales bacterium]USN51803.1 MAG: 3-oxoacid CoA-transferase subunit B [Myxococcales bacterium]
MPFSREQMAQIVADMIIDGQTLNLGIGMPTMVADYLEHRPLMIHSENGLLGMGPYPFEHEVDAQIINAGKETVSIKKGGSTFDSSFSFGMIRGGHIDVAVLGAMQVSKNGDLANWQIPGKKVTGMGGAMDLALGAKKLIIMMQHFDKNHQPKLVKECSLPLTARGCVDVVVTDYGVFNINKESGQFEIVQLAPEIDKNNNSLFG